MIKKKFANLTINKDFCTILFLLIILCIIGIVLQFSAGNGNLKVFALPQIIKILIGLVLFFIIYSLKPSFIFNIVEFLYLLCLLLVIFVEILGSIRLGAQRWLSIGLLIIQPSEFMKIATILMLAKILYKIPTGHEDKLKYYIIPAIISVIPCLLIILQPDLGTAFIIIATTIVIFFVAGLRIRYFIIAIITALIAAPLMWFNLYNYQKDRILVFLNPNKDPLGSGYHIIQSKIAIGSGGLLGKGLLKGSQSQLNFIPEKQTDFIFSLLTEEQGFLGALFLITIYSTLIGYCLILSTKTNNIFVRYCIIGLTFIFFIQIFFNMGMVIGILPVVGVPMPLISYGGTSIITTLAIFAIILNIIKDDHSNIE